MVRISVIDTLHEDFVRTARAKGVREQRLMRRHVLPNASLRVLTMVGMEVGTAIGVCIYIEAAFGFSGLGASAIRQLSAAALDLPQILAVVTSITLIVVIGNLIVDRSTGHRPAGDARSGRRAKRRRLAGGVI